MQLRVGLTDNDLKTLAHRRHSISASSAAKVSVAASSSPAVRSFQLPAGQPLLVMADGDVLVLSGASVPAEFKHLIGRLLVSPAGAGGYLQILTLKRDGRTPVRYRGDLELSAQSGLIKVVLITDLESYLEGVLGSEIPASYHLEAVKAQAVAARTYALCPRISHEPDGFNVCDSYLCCQYFAGLGNTSGKHRQAIDQTRDEILTYGGKPILALFSSCAGGHTENYHACFSDPVTGAFPPPPIPYLRGIPEGRLPDEFPDESAMRKLWSTPQPSTVDAWSGHFKWKIRLPAEALEAHMHHQVETLSRDPQFAPFIVPPASGLFGHIDRFEIRQRGVAGTVIWLFIHTSAGIWKIAKELTIRSIFANPDAGLKRLKSARIFFDYKRDRLGLLAEVTVSGLGWGHGVGMQQTGAEGLARQGKAYKEILSHYFSGAEITQAESARKFPD